MRAERSGLRTAIIAALVVALGLVALTFPPLQLIAENAELSWLFSARGARAAPRDIVVVSLDSSSRASYAQLIDRLHAARARVIGFNRPLDSPQSTADDMALAGAMRKAGNVVLLAGGETQAQLRDAARATAAFPLPRYPQRVNRIAVRVAGSAGGLVLPATMLREIAPERFDDSKVPDRIYLNYFGAAGSIETVSYSSALHDASADKFAGKAVLVGGPVPEKNQYELQRTVFSQLSDTEIAATAFANLRDGNWLRAPGFGVSVALVVVWGVAVSLLLGRFTTAVVVGVAIASGALFFGVALALFARADVWLPLFVPVVVQIPVALFGVTIATHLRENRAKRAIRDVLERRLPASTIDAIADDIAGGRRTEHEVHAACVATDANSYSTLAERMSPQVLSQFINRYYGVLFPVVRRHDGFVAEIVGDAMLATWVSIASDARRRTQACRAALEMAQSIDAFNRAQPLPMPTGFGVHAGEMGRARMGTTGTFEYRADGELARVAARVRQLNTQLGTRVLATAEALSDVTGVLIRPLGKFRLDDVALPLELFELAAHADQATDAERRRCELFARGLKQFHARAWNDARQEFHSLLAEFSGDGPARYFLDRCTRFAANPPAPDWDGAIDPDADIVVTSRAI